MAFLRRNNVLLLVKSCNIRLSSDNSGTSFWKIAHKQWRKPRFQQPDPDSITDKLAPSTSTVKMVGTLNPFRAQTFRSSTNMQEDAASEIVQDESEKMGHSAALAQYLVYMGAKVKFSQFPEWIDRDENYSQMHRASDIGNVLRGIDISFTDMDYKALKPLTAVRTVKFFYAESCKYFDDYCLDHICASLQHLEELDLRDCPLITSRGLGVLYRLKYLRKLQLNGIKFDTELELLCILLEEHFPNLTIEGVTYQAG